MTADADRFVRATLAEMDRSQFRPDPVERPRLGSTEWSLAYLEPWEYRALAAFLADLVARAPLVGPSFSGHRMVLSALSHDLIIAANSEGTDAV